jgi:hypothetical protein
MAYVIIKNRKDLGNPDFVSRYGMFMTDVKSTRICSALYHVVFMVKRGLLAILLITMYDYPFEQLILLMITSMIYIIYMFKVRPFEEEE